MKIVFICSTNGSVIKKALSTSLLCGYDIEFVSDRCCGIIDFAESNGFNYRVLNSQSGREFSSLLSTLYSDSDSDDILFVSFYTRLLSDVFLKNHPGKVINFHPSILPAFPGLDGFGDTMKSGALFFGSTVHFVDEGMDTGAPILQAVYPRDPSVCVTKHRHRVFLQQVISLIQVIDWFSNSDVISGNEAYTQNISFKHSEFSPNISSEYMAIYQEWLSEKL